ncbi:MAG: protein kinase [bacterium]|nr:protein kinase [bacterium]MDT8364984.1 protein kinase [bacterium]
MDPGRRSRVVFFEPGNGTGKALAEQLRRGGLDVVIAPNLKTAHKAAANADVIVANITHTSDGPALCRALRTESGTGSLPLLALSEVELSDNRLGELLSAGAMDVFSPPISPPLLLARVGNLVRIHHEEAYLQETERRYRKIFSSSHQGYFLSTREGRFLEVNDALLNILGYTSKQEMLKLRLPDDLYVNPRDRDVLQLLIEKKGFIKDFKVDFKRKDGSRITILLTANTYKNMEGETLGYEGFNIPLMDTAIPIRHRMLNLMLRPFRRVMAHRKNFISVARISEMVADQYEKVEELSEGFYTSVWKGRDVLGFEQGTLVIKISKSEAINSRLILEAKAMRDLAGHPGIPELVDVASHRGRTVIITRYVEGHPLTDILPLEDDRARDRIAYQLMDVVSHLHDNDIVHRDIKPDNIIVRPDGTIVLLDYGIVRRMKEMETSATVIGTRPYMSPEQINGRSERRSDIWALGVVMYQLYTGSLPFSGNTEIELMQNILNVEPASPRSFNPGLSAQMESALIRALRKRPQGRFNNGREMRDHILTTVPGFQRSVQELIREPEMPPTLVP